MDCGFHVVDPGLHVLDSRFQSLAVFWIPSPGFRISPANFSGISEPTSKDLPDSRIRTTLHEAISYFSSAYGTVSGGLRYLGYLYLATKSVNNGNRTEWSPIRSVIIRMINIITSMITDRIGRHEVLLPIYHNYNKICDILGFFETKNKRNSVSFFFASIKKAD